MKHPKTFTCGKCRKVVVDETGELICPDCDKQLNTEEED